MKNIMKKGMSGLLAVVMCLSTFIGIGATPVFAASETSESYSVGFPRDGDAVQVYDENVWGHSAKKYMNGWYTDASTMTTIHWPDRQLLQLIRRQSLSERLLRLLSKQSLPP